MPPSGPQLNKEKQLECKELTRRLYMVDDMPLKALLVELRKKGFDFT